MEMHLTKGDVLGIAKSKFEKLGALFVPATHLYNIRTSLESLDDLLERDKRRKEDGFPSRIKIGRILAGPNKAILVPSVEEEKFIHGEFEPGGQGNGMAGHGKGEEGDVIGELPIEGECDCDGDPSQSGQDGDGNHGIETEAYKVGKELSEKFQLPNLKDKGKKVPTTDYIYDLTDRYRGAGQVLDEEETLRSVIETNFALGRVDKDHLDTNKLIVGPDDEIYRVLSRERVWKSQAIAFFMRDYSGSTTGGPTKAIGTQHLMIYSWLLVQYEKLVIPRFIVHDTAAKEVSAEMYFKLNSGGGTLISSGYKKINEIVETEGLAKNYNIYVFQGTDGDDWDSGGETDQAISEINKILTYANRMGVSVMTNEWTGGSETMFESYIKASGIPENKQLFRMHVMSSKNVTEEQNVEAIKHLIGQD